MEYEVLFIVQLEAESKQELYNTFSKYISTP